MKFYTQFDETDRFVSNAGSPIQDEYALVLDDNGIYDLAVKGKTNLYDYIQSHADSVDINKILERFANGDESALNKYSGFYGDITDLPTSYADMLNKLSKAEDMFNSLPVDLKEKFNFSPEQFIASIGSDEFNSVISKFTPQVVDKVVDNVVDVNEVVKDE